MVGAIHTLEAEPESTPSETKTVPKEALNTDAPDSIIEQEKGIPSVEELEVVPIPRSGKTTNVGAALSGGAKEHFVEFLKKNADIFAWSHEDMPDINPLVVVHRINVDPSA